MEFLKITFLLLHKFALAFAVKFEIHHCLVHCVILHSISIKTLCARHLSGVETRVKRKTTSLLCCLLVLKVCEMFIYLGVAICCTLLVGNTLHLVGLKDIVLITHFFL